MSNDYKARVGITDADLSFYEHRDAFAWRFLEDERSRLPDLDGTAFSSEFSSELYAARAALEDAIGLVVASLRARLAPKSKRGKAEAAADAPKRRRGRPLGSRTKSPAEKSAEARTVPLLPIETTNGTTAPTGAHGGGHA